MLISYNLLYVTDMEKSREFYKKLLSRDPVEASPTFTLFVQENGSKFGLWQKEGVVPAATVPGGAEFAIALENAGDLDPLAERLANYGALIAQKPETMDFGRTFTALDPDGHRLRFFVPGGM